MSHRFLIYGHRGSPKRFPENTLASFDEALRAGADGFETDLRLLADGTAVLHHDDEVNEAPVESLSIAHLASPARVSDLARYAGRTRMILEIKRRGWDDTLLSLIAGWPDIVLASFDHSLIAGLHERGVTIPLGITFVGVIAGVADYAASIGATWAFPNHRYVDEAMVGPLHARGIRVVPWTVNRMRDFERVRAVGCDGAISDLPEQAVRWRS